MSALSAAISECSEAACTGPSFTCRMKLPPRKKAHVDVGLEGVDMAEGCIRRTGGVLLARRAQLSPPGMSRRSLTLVSAFLRILMLIISTPSEKAIAK